MEIRRTGPGTCWVIDGPHVRPFTIPALAATLGVTVQTVRRWCRGDPIPRTAELALRFITGALDHPGWRDWRIGPDGRLCAPSGHTWQPVELEGYELLFSTNRVLWQRLAELDNKPAPKRATRTAPRRLSR